tara:strand:+ start:234 stop:533 length:300 start_codon:yes stop_codon:yes gene_type:complete
MFLRIGTMRFPSKDKMDAYIAMIQTVFLKKFQEETLMLQPLLIKTGEGRLAGYGLYKSKEDFLKTGSKTKKLLTDLVKSQGGIVEFNDGEVIVDWKRET